WSNVNLSASYLRQHLMERQLYSELQTFEESLLNISSGSCDQLLNLARAQQLNMQPAKALVTLRHVLLFEPQKAESIESLHREIQESNLKISAEESERPNLLG